MVFRLAVVFKLTAAIYAEIKLTAPTNPVEFTVFNRRYWYTETGSLSIPIPDLRYQEILTEQRSNDLSQNFNLKHYVDTEEEVE